MADQDNELRTLVAEIAAAYFSNSHVGPSEIPNVIAQIAASLEAVGKSSELPILEEALEPTAMAKATRSQVQKSITSDALISFEDGRPYKTLRRHLSVKGLSPEQYRQKWGLPADYPMTAPSYSAQRKMLAQQIGLGRKATPPPEPAPKTRGRRKTSAPVS